jgi:dCMP deaminase
MKEEKLSWDDYFLEIVKTVALRATCDRGKSGCVVTKNNRILVTGYVGAPSGISDCNEIGHLLEKVIHTDGSISEHCHRSVHAETNALLQAARIGVSLEGATLYCSMTPCMKCAMSIIQVGITRVVCEKKYHQGKISEELFSKANIEIMFKHDEIMTYDKSRN